MQLDEFETSVGTLQRMRMSDALLQAFQAEDLRRSVGLVNAPSRETLGELLDEDDLVVWEVVPDGANTSAGYAIFVGYDGPPYFAFWFPNAPNARDLIEGCLEALMHAFFEHTEEPSLFFYADKPVAEEVHEHLLDAGYDLFEDNPTINNEKLACYVLERYTYDAYYGENEDDRSFDY